MNVFERVVEHLKMEPLLDGFTYVKGKYAFEKKTNGIRYRLALHHRFFFNLSLDIKPIYDVRFDILHKWFEKFCVRSIKDQRYGWTLGTSIAPREFDLPDRYEFCFYGENFEEMYNHLLFTVRKLLMVGLPKFSCIEDYYHKVVEPRIVGKEKFLGVGVDWVFEYLTSVRIVAPEKYEEAKRVIMSHVKQMIAYGEPNALDYDGNWDEIFAYLESLDFSSGKAREPKTTTKKTRKSKEKKDE